MILMGTDPLLGPLERSGSKNLVFLKAQMALASSLAISGPKEVSIFRARPFQIPMALVMDLPASNSLYLPPYKQQVH
jgi:hypothetical protein